MTESMAIEVSGQIDAKLGDVWALVGEFDAITRWNSEAIAVTVKGSGVGAERSVSATDGGVTVERIEYLDPPNFIRYSVVATEPSKPIVGVTAAIRLSAVDATHTNIVWRTEFPAGLNVSQSLADAIRSSLGTRIDLLRSSAGRV
ncbi:MAG: hypothetical protein C0482_22140 [Gordonia sp.]|nr:hypothetical protein [Gordonia sp. (in: high G+C Gram-positive bacteria)]